MKVNFKIEGAGDTKRKLSLWDMEKKKKAQQIVRKTTRNVGRKARKDVPVSPSNRKKSAGSPGDLKKSIRSKYYHNDLVSATYPRIPKGAHRSIVSKGTTTRTTKAGANRGRVKPQKFMEPAKQSQEASYNSQMKSLWEGGEDTI